MTTQAMTSVASASRGNLAERAFFVGMALAMIITVFVGFAPSYYVPRADAQQLTPLLHIHGAAATAWMLLFLTQTGLVAAHRVDIHRRLGLAGAAVAIILAIFTTTVSIISRGLTPKLTFAAAVAASHLTHRT